ncbi:hypothetical protein BV25DRAFT_1829265 [Artomyces pyxidatus]|uniref:Uncharacterized protein n=1 Tax=Artomyces pyxidatus TaxID=48021 RepID=A0ACB8SSM7_9AGAM|nr:hypothetical protein BV25DRAFT_1829265 [Artomyces pyxidatus]
MSESHSVPRPRAYDSRASSSTAPLLPRKPEAIGDEVFLLRPAEEYSTQNAARDPAHANDPTLILLCGWMGALMPHLLKYSQGYSALYPYATQVLVRCPRSSFFLSQNSMRALLEPVLDVLRDFDYLDTNSARSSIPRRILIHLFSNGGAFTLTRLSEMLTSPTARSSREALPCAVVFDSAPGINGLVRTVKAFTGHVANPLLRYLAAFTLGSLHILTKVIQFVFRTEDIVVALRRKLNSPNIVPWANADTPRLYIYSTGDELVPFTAVEKHASDGRALGFNVEMEKFGKNPHVTHMRSNPERYWDAIRRVWASVGTV